MSSVLLAALHSTGAAANLEPLVRTLIARGHEVTVLSDEAARSHCTALGAAFVAVPDPVLPSAGQRPASRLDRIRRLRPNMRAAFLDPVPSQWAAVQQVLATTPVDVVLTDMMVFGVGLLAAVPADERPAVVTIGMVPPPATDPAVAPYGTGLAPIPGALGRLRDLVLDLFVAAPALAPIHREFRQAVEQHTGYRITGSMWDLPTRSDVWAQAAVDRFEYPRDRPPANLQWVGPLASQEDPTVPDWWDPVTEPPVVVLHTDGRVGLDRLVLPGIEALADSGSTVVVAGATRAQVAIAYGRALPANVHFERDVPWSRLVAGKAAFVSTGDYVQVQHALRHGLPVVVTGDSEPQVETKARVEWAGVGVDVPAAQPTPEMIRHALARVAADQSVRLAVARIAAQIAATDAERSICDLVEQLTEQQSTRPTPAGALRG